MADLNRPDFVCERCGHGVFGKEPVHCIKCGGMLFKGCREIRTTRNLQDGAAAGLRRIMHEAAELVETIRTSDIRKGPRFELLAHLAAIEKRSQAGIRMLTRVPDLVSKKPR